MLYKMLNFVNACPISCLTVVVDRKEAKDKVSLSGKLAKTINKAMVEHQKYRLLQAADFICSMELLKIKYNEKRLSKSKKQFFYKPQELKKTFFKSIERKKIKC